MSTACILLAPGFEEIEAVTLLDVLRRSGVRTTALGIVDRTVRGAHDIILEADTTLSEAQAQRYDAVLLPGGMPGSANLRDSQAVRAFVLAHRDAGCLVGAICAAPIALASFGVLQGKRATCFPGFEDEVQRGGATIVGDAVAEDGGILTSRGPGTALPFALALVGRLVGDKKAKHVGMSMLVL